MESGFYLRELRNNKKFSLRSLSIKSGVSHTQISDLEKGINFGTVEKLEKILKALGATEEQKMKFYYLRDYEKTPETIKKELNEYKSIPLEILKNRAEHLTEKLKKLSVEELTKLEEYIDFLLIKRK
ncbi:helix-turn-helix domain-containing protein [Fusobacterium sp. MFO224]|uniref:helix-turn-helix domain-containing protein n=1 Tax=Fusobacterium sp. MFO224 TaxID=3378070 RepID=UPI0038542D08